MSTAAWVAVGSVVVVGGGIGAYFLLRKSGDAPGGTGAGLDSMGGGGGGGGGGSPSRGYEEGFAYGGQGAGGAGSFVTASPAAGVVNAPAGNAPGNMTIARAAATSGGRSMQGGLEGADAIARARGGAGTAAAAAPAPTLVKTAEVKSSFVNAGFRNQLSTSTAAPRAGFQYVGSR